MQKRLGCIYINVNIKRCFQVNMYASINFIFSNFICVMSQKKDNALCSLFPFQMFIPSLKSFNICIVFSVVQWKECKMYSYYHCHIIIVLHYQHYERMIHVRSYLCFLFPINPMLSSRLCLVSGRHNKKYSSENWKCTLFSKLQKQHLYRIRE